MDTFHPLAAVPSRGSEHPFDKHSIGTHRSNNEPGIVMEIKGAFATAKVFARSIENEAYLQIKAICDNDTYAGQTIRIMPDVHAGKGALVGFTARIADKINPWLIGVDIGCGLLSVKLGRIRWNPEKLDRSIRRNIPYGPSRHEQTPEDIDPVFAERIASACQRIGADPEACLRTLGTLGGGNHFIEVDASKNGDLWLMIHSGSRNFGFAVAEHHQRIAAAHVESLGLANRTPWLSGQALSDYLANLELAQEFASRNRRKIADCILHHLGVGSDTETFETFHNYVDFRRGVLRKGAVSAEFGERIAVPLNMRDGVLIARGKGIEDWNWSAPHGAGRKMSRTKARESIDLDSYRKSMKGIWTSCVSERTLDEAPQAYKPSKEIKEQLPETAEIEELLVPVYNFKAN